MGKSSIHRLFNIRKNPKVIFSYQPFIVNFEVPKLTFASEVPGDKDPDAPGIDDAMVKSVNNLVPVGWHMTSVHPPFFNLKANSDDIVCLLCQRVHDHEHQ